MSIAKQDATDFRIHARSMYFSNETVEHTLANATTGQIKRICDMIAFERTVRELRKKERLFRRATFPQIKSFEGYDFSQVSFPDGYLPSDLKELAFIEMAQDFVFYGQTGRGKTHLAIATGVAAINAGKQVRFFTTAQLVMALIKANSSDTLDAFMSDIAKCDLIILDDLDMCP